jgi:predicted amidohydrolase
VIYRAGFYQFDPAFLQPDANREHIAAVLKGVRADLIVLPELAMSGYFFGSVDEVAAMAEHPQEGPTAQLMRNLSRENDCSYFIGFVELAENGFYNSAMLVNPDGEIHVYRKTHLFYREKLFFLPGDTGFRTVNARGGVPVGPMICFDWYYPESARTLALQGAKILIQSANLVLPWCQQAMLTRSLENRVFSITANRVGTERQGDKELAYSGASQVVGPLGDLRYRAPETGDCLHIEEIDPDYADDKWITPMNHLWDDRRADSYFTT